MLSYTPFHLPTASQIAFTNCRSLSERDWPFTSANCFSTSASPAVTALRSSSSEPRSFIRVATRVPSSLPCTRANRLWILSAILIVLAVGPVASTSASLIAPALRMPNHDDTAISKPSSPTPLNSFCPIVQFCISISLSFNSFSLPLLTRPDLDDPLGGLTRRRLPVGPAQRLNGRTLIL